MFEAEEREPPDVTQADGVAETGDEKIAGVAPPPAIGGIRHHRHHET